VVNTKAVYRDYCRSCMKNYESRTFTRKKHLVALTDDTVPWAASWRCCQHLHPILQEYFSEFLFRGCIGASLTYTQAAVNNWRYRKWKCTFGWSPVSVRTQYMGPVIRWVVGRKPMLAKKMQFLARNKKYVGHVCMYL
jgi:hypothetical protein